MISCNCHIPGAAAESFQHTELEHSCCCFGCQVISAFLSYTICTAAFVAVERCVGFCRYVSIAGVCSWPCSSVRKVQTPRCVNCTTCCTDPMLLYSLPYQNPIMCPVLNIYPADYLHIACAQLLSETAFNKRIFFCHQHLDLILESCRAGSVSWK